MGHDFTDYVEICGLVFLIVTFLFAETYYSKFAKPTIKPAPIAV